MKHIIALLVCVLFLTACQQEEKHSNTQSVEKSKQNSSEKPVESKTIANAAKSDESEKKAPAEHQHTGHQHTEKAHDHEHSDVPLVVVAEKYTVIDSQMECEQPVVHEFFAYQCPHCYNLEPAAEEWRKKNAGKVKFVSVPTHLGNERMGSLLLVHHAAKKMGILDKVQHHIFKRFHEDKKLFSSPEEAAQFLVDLGADKKTTESVLADQKNLQEAMVADYQLLAKYKITSVPQVLVNHKYMTSMAMAGGAKEVFEVVDEVLKLESGCKKK